MNKKGFTLIELLIAISIVAIISGILFGTVTQLQKKGRDAQRRTDLAALQSALQQYYSDFDFYPYSGTPPPLSGAKLDLASTTSLTSSIGLLTASAPSVTKTYLAKIPTDPVKGKFYYYAAFKSSQNSTSCNNTSGESCQYYVVCTFLEDGSTAISSIDPFCPSTATVNYNYRVTPIN